MYAIRSYYDKMLVDAMTTRMVLAMGLGTGLAGAGLLTAAIEFTTSYNFV